MSLNLHLLRLFATVAQTGSFSRAAELLHISQPAISKGVRDFEEQVGCRLLDRGPKGVRPTLEGDSLLRHTKLLFATERAAEEELRALRGLHRGSLRIGASTTIATYMIPDHLGTFHRAYPEIELHIVSANTRRIADLLINHAIDVALVEGPVEEPSIVSEAWQQDRMVLIAAPDHPFVRNGASIEPPMLDGEVFIVREPGSGSREIVNDALCAHGIHPARTLEVGSTEAIKQLVAGGLGVAIVSVATIKDQLATGRLRVVTIIGMAVDRMLWKLMVPGRLQTPAAAAFEKLVLGSTDCPIALASISKPSSSPRKAALSPARFQGA